MGELRRPLLHFVFVVIIPARAPRPVRVNQDRYQCCADLLLLLPGFASITEPVPGGQEGAAVESTPSIHARHGPGPAAYPRLKISGRPDV